MSETKPNTAQLLTDFAAGRPASAHARISMILSPVGQWGTVLIGPRDEGRGPSAPGTRAARRAKAVLIPSLLRQLRHQHLDRLLELGVAAGRDLGRVRLDLVGRRELLVLHHVALHVG